MNIPTEPIGSVPRPPELIEAITEKGSDHPDLEPLYDAAIRDTVEQMERTGSPVVSDGEQKKYHNFWTYAVEGLPNTAPGGFRIPFVAGHVRRMLRLTSGPFRYRVYADSYLEAVKRDTRLPVKQAVISPSALSLMYPADEIPDYPRSQFIDDLLREHEHEVRQCLNKGAHCVQIDFTEARLAVKIDRSGELLNSFIDLNNLALSRFSAAERKLIGVHTCPGGDRDSTHSADIDYGELLPSLFQLKAGNFYVALAGERDRRYVLDIIRACMKPDQRVFVGVIAPIDPRVETPEEVRDRVLEGGRIHPRRATGHHGRLRVLAVLRRHLDDAGDGFRQDPRPRAGNGAGRRRTRGQAMSSGDEEEARLRTVALENARSIMLAREHAEEALREETHALEVLNETGILLASKLALQPLLQAVTDAATELSGAEFGAFFYNVTDEQGHATRCRARRGKRSRSSAIRVPRRCSGRRSTGRAPYARTIS